MLKIDSLEKGVVIDHIKAGGSMDLYHYLGLDQLDCSVAIIKNVKSRKMGRKDIIKIEGVVDLDLDVLGFIDHNITVNIVCDGGIVEKKNLTLPGEVTNVIRCRNPRCITSVEPELPNVFRLCDSQRHLYRCIYCEQEYQEM